MAKRIKQVMDAADVAHFWANQTQDHARTATHNFYYNGTSIYSYGSHFRIAEMIPIPAERKGEINMLFGINLWQDNLVLFTDRTYSNTTAKHISLTRHACSHLPRLVMSVFVEELTSEGMDEWSLASWNRKHKENIAKYRAYIEEHKQKAERARATWMISNYTSTVRSEAHTAIVYLTLYGLFNKPEWKECFTYLMDMAEYEREVVVKDPVSEEKREKARLARQKSAQKKLEVEKEAWLNGTEDWAYNWNRKTPMLEKITAAFGVLLRVSGDTVQTTKSANVPVADARKLLRLVRLVKETGKDLSEAIAKKNIVVGHYAVSRITSDGDLIVGCHSIKNEEIERLAQQQGWEDAVTIESLS